VPGGVGEAVLAAQRARVVGEQGDLVLDLVALGEAGDRRHLRRPGLQHRQGRRVRDQFPHDQGEVVGGGRLPGDVEPGRGAGDGVEGLQALRRRVHRRQRRLHATGGPRQGVGRVVARLHHQRLEQQ
jgi:hypothetical protein